MGGKHFIINTAENGRGPVHYNRAGTGHQRLVQPRPARARARPTTQTSNPKVDAYLWINRPGFAQSCQGRPIAWFVPRALTYARYATDWEKPPPGSRFGHLKHYPLSKFGIP